MIFCLLLELSRNQQGQHLRRQKMISGESLQIGRGVACKIHLPDARVELHHATLTQTSEGKLYITAEAPIKVDGLVRQHAPLPPGSRVEIGPYLLIIDTASSGPYITISLEAIEHVEEIQPHDVPDDQNLYENVAVTLADLGISKRKWGFWLATLIFLLFLVLPVLPHAVPELDEWQSALPVTLTDSWNPGPLSKGHSVFGAQCSTCHREPFKSVPDAACVECHKNVSAHLSDNAEHSRLFRNTHCTDCHVDHQGTAGLRFRHDSSLCVSCHGDLKRKKSNTTVANVHDFSSDHPAFNIAIQNIPGMPPANRGPMNKITKSLEETGLKFSHQLHLDTTGISTPQGDTVLVCRNCHQTDESVSHFAPISMEKSCQQSDCHSLEFSEPAEGVIPHGSEREVMDRLRGFYVRWLAESPENFVECEIGNKANNTLRLSLACANDLAKNNAQTTLFNQDGVCSECHEIKTADDNETPWKVTPVKINRDYHSNSIFPHEKHSLTDCVACHDKTNSESSSDISMPPIDKCRECHVGERPEKGKASNSCDSCHQFHGAGK